MADEPALTATLLAPLLAQWDTSWWMNRELIAHGSDASTVRDLYPAR